MHEIFKHIHVLYYILETSLFVILVKLVSRIMFGYCTRIKKKKPDRKENEYEIVFDSNI
jgi:hypothetical protein